MMICSAAMKHLYGYFLKQATLLHKLPTKGSPSTDVVSQVSMSSKVKPCCDNQTRPTQYLKRTFSNLTTSLIVTVGGSKQLHRP